VNTSNCNYCSGKRFKEVTNNSQISEESVEEEKDDQDKEEIH